MTYNSKEDIMSIFNITISDNDEIIKELKKIQKESHPDVNQQNDTNTDNVTLFLNVTEAINYMNNLNENNSPNNALVVINKMNELLTNLNLDKQDSNLNFAKETFNNSLEASQKRLKSHYKIPKITSATIVGIISFLWLFPNSISENPFLNDIINTDTFLFTCIWLTLLIYLACFLLIIRNLEIYYSELIELIQTEDFQEIIFESFKKAYKNKTFNKRNLTQHIEIILNAFIFHKKNYIDNRQFEYNCDYFEFIDEQFEIFSKYKFQNKFLDNFIPIENTTIDVLASVIIEKALATEVIQKSTMQSFSKIYTISNCE